MVHTKRIPTNWAIAAAAKKCAFPFKCGYQLVQAAILVGERKTTLPLWFGDIKIV